MILNFPVRYHGYFTISRDHHIKIFNRKNTAEAVISRTKWLGIKLTVTASPRVHIHFIEEYNVTHEDIRSALCTIKKGPSHCRGVVNVGHMLNLSWWMGNSWAAGPLEMTEEKLMMMTRYGCSIKTTSSVCRWRSNSNLRYFFHLLFIVYF